VILFMIFIDDLNHRFKSHDLNQIHCDEPYY